MDNTHKKFLIKVAKLCTGSARHRLGNIEYSVSYDKMAEQIQSIRRMGGKILSITEIN